jgi:cell division transport system permease protein
VDYGRIRFFVSEVWRSFTRNVLMQITAVGTVAVTIVLLGSFLFARQTLTTIGDDAVRKIEISVFLGDAVSAPDAQTLARKIGTDPRVKSVTYVSREQGLKEMRERLKGQIDTSLLTSNPLPNALRVRSVDPKDVGPLAGDIRKMPGVATVAYGQDAVQKLLQISKTLGKIGLTIVGVLVFTAAIIISNTIRLTVFARRREIAIMQLVGASGTYVRMPFVCEGTIAGLLGALVAVALLAIAKFELLPKIGAELPFVPLQSVASNDILLALQLLGVGAGVGFVASWLSVSRYLRA